MSCPKPWCRGQNQGLNRTDVTHGDVTHMHFFSKNIQTLQGHNFLNIYQLGLRLEYIVEEGLLFHFIEDELLPGRPWAPVFPPFFHLLGPVWCLPRSSTWEGLMPPPAHLSPSLRLGIQDVRPGGGGIRPSPFFPFPPLFFLFFFPFSPSFFLQILHFWASHALLCWGTTGWHFP